MTRITCDRCGIAVARKTQYRVSVFKYTEWTEDDTVHADLCVDCARVAEDLIRDFATRLPRPVVT